jgi:hypothetical protein
VTTSVSRHDNVPLVSSTVDIMKKQPCLRIYYTALIEQGESHWWDCAPLSLVAHNPAT